MIRILLATTALTLSTAAVAQQVETPSAQTPPATQMPADPTVSQPTAQPAPLPADPSTLDVDPATGETAPATPDAEPLPAQQGHDVGHDAATPAPPPGETDEPQATEAAANSADTVARVVEADFATYDAEGTGELTQEQFGRWMTALRGEQTGDADTWNATAFAQADSDSSDGVSREELTRFLQG